MIKSIFQVILMILGTLCSAQQKLALTRADFNVNSDVKSFTLTTKNYNHPNKIIEDNKNFYIQNDSNFVSEYYFNDLGYLIESKDLQSAYTWKKYDFREDEKKILLIKISIYTKQKIKDKFVSNYTISIEYKDKSALVTTLFENGKKQTVLRYLDINDNVIKEHFVPITKREFIYNYNEKNHITKKNRDSENFTDYTYAYNLTGEMIYKNEIDQDQREISTTFQNGLPMTEKHSEGYVFKYEYEVDAHKNWTKRITTINDVLVAEDFRIYKY